MLPAIMLIVNHPVSVFPPEILDEIIDNLDDKSTLLSLGLVCRRALVKSRRCLFSSLEFTNHKTFDRFLRRAGAPWTSFTLAVKEIHLQDVFHHRFRYRKKWDPTQVASNLCNVKSLSISAHEMSKIGWKVVPPPVLEVIFQLNLQDLQLDGVGYWLRGETKMFFSRLPPSIKTFAFQKLKFKSLEKPDLSHDLSIFPRSFQFRMLDNISLALLGDGLDPSINPGVKIMVQMFYIRPYDEHVPLTQRFLHHMGHCVEQLFIFFEDYSPATTGLQMHGMHIFMLNIWHLSEQLSADGSPLYLDPAQLTQCINVRIIYFIFPLNAIQQPRIVFKLAMWKMLLALPSPNTLEEYWLRITPYQDLKEDLSCLGFFESPNLLHKLRCMFPNLKIIKIIMGTWLGPSDRSHSYLKLLWQMKDLTAFEEIGLVKVVVIDLSKHVACHSSIEGCGYLYSWIYTSCSICMYNCQTMFKHNLRRMRFTVECREDCSSYKYTLTTGSCP